MKKTYLIRTEHWTTRSVQVSSSTWRTDNCVVEYFIVTGYREAKAAAEKLSGRYRGYVYLLQDMRSDVEAMNDPENNWTRFVIQQF